MTQNLDFKSLLGENESVKNLFSLKFWNRFLSMEKILYT